MEVLYKVNEPGEIYSTGTTAPENYSTTLQFPESGKNISNSTVFSEYPVIPSHIRIHIHKLNSFEGLAENWDSYGAFPPNKETIEQARLFLMDNAFVSLPFYFIAPGINGEILIECQQNEKSSEIFFNPDGSTELLLFENDECIRETNLEEGFTELVNFFND